MSNRFTTSTRMNVREDPLYVAICTGTMGYREKSKGNKILQLHHGVSILEIQMQTIKQMYPYSEIMVTTGFDSDKIIKNRPQVPVVENQIWENTNTLEELRLYFNLVYPSRLLIIDGAIYFNKNTIENLTESCVMSCYNNNDKDIGLHSLDDKVEHFGFGLEKKWSGLVYLEGKPLEAFKKICKKENNKLSLFEGLNLLLQQNMEIKCIDNIHAEIIKL